jgi:NAD(P)-dependent dehydrogenase (short-subunit alcohol dehydrogenase family)
VYLFFQKSINNFLNKTASLTAHIGSIMRFGVKLIYLNLIALLGYVIVKAMNSGAPVSIKDRFSAANVAKSALLAAGLVGGKVLVNGPTFNEAVSLKGKNIVITGANTGLGKESALKLATLGANVFLLCKSSDKASGAVEDIKRKTGSKSVVAIPCNLASLESVQSAVSSLKREVDSLDILMNNAGVMAIPTRETTLDGFEAHLGINHLGHFALTGLLMDLLAKSTAARIVTVSSAAHLLGHFDFDDILLEKNYEPWHAYGNSKLANILFTKELATRLESVSNITPLTCHPGACRTELGRCSI